MLWNSISTAAGKRSISLKNNHIYIESNRKQTNKQKTPVLKPSSEALNSSIKIT